MKKFLFSGTENALSTDLMLAVFRIFAGLSMAFGHGIKKVPPSEGFVEHVGDMGFPLPEFFAYAAGFSEFGGALLLALGLFTRPAAFFVGITMFVAAFINHAGDPFGNGEKSYLYFAIAVVYMVIGSGKFSLDSWIRRKYNI